MSRPWVRWWVPALGIVLAWALAISPLAAQAPSLVASVLWNVGANQSLPENRLQFGARFHPCFGPLCLQAWAMLVRDDVGRIARPFRAFTHFGFSADIGSRRWRVGASTMQFDEHVTEARRQYYRAVGLLLRYAGPVDITVEPQLFQFDLATSTPVHAVRSVLRWRFLTADIQQTTSRGQPDARDHWTGTLAIARRPFMVRVGTQSIPSATVNRNEPRFLVQAGFFWATR